MVGRRSIPFGARPIFKCYVSFREGSIISSWVSVAEFCWSFLVPPIFPTGDMGDGKIRRSSCLSLAKSHRTFGGLDLFLSTNLLTTALITLPETSSSHLKNKPGPKRKRSSSNHPFSGANLLLVSERSFS